MLPTATDMVRLTRGLCRKLLQFFIQGNTSQQRYDFYLHRKRWRPVFRKHERMVISLIFTGFTNKMACTIVKKLLTVNFGRIGVGVF